MVKINLLPVRSNKKQELVKKQLLIAVLVIMGTFACCGISYWFTLSKISVAKQEIVKSEKEIASLKIKIGEIDNLKKLQDEVKRKLDVLDQLRKNKTGPAMRLAHLCDATPEKLWLTKFMESTTSISMAGVAFSEELIADFMRNLMASGDYTNVDLQVSEQVEMSGVKAKKFELLCLLKSAQPQPPKDGAAPKK